MKSNKVINTIAKSTVASLVGKSATTTTTASNHINNNSTDNNRSSKNYQNKNKKRARVPSPPPSSSTTTAATRTTRDAAPAATRPRRGNSSHGGKPKEYIKTTFETTINNSNNNNNNNKNNNNIRGGAAPTAAAAAAAAESPNVSGNRLLVFCSSINDMTAWPFWKFLQLKKTSELQQQQQQQQHNNNNNNNNNNNSCCARAAGLINDVAMLAFNSNGGSFEAHIEGSTISTKNKLQQERTKQARRKHLGSVDTFVNEFSLSKPPTTTNNNHNNHHNHNLTIPPLVGLGGNQKHDKEQTIRMPAHRSRWTLRNLHHIREYRNEVFQDFIKTYHDPGRTYFIYGGHGMGDYMELEQHAMALQVHELAALFERRQFEAVLFDACFMANLDCAYYLRHNTRWVGACEGYMWEPDSSLDYHIFNSQTAALLSRGGSCPRENLLAIQELYCSKTSRGDFAVLDTRHAAALHDFVERRVVPRVYARAGFYNAAQRSALRALTAAKERRAEVEFGLPGGEDRQVMDSIHLGVAAAGRKVRATLEAVAAALPALVQPGKLAAPLHLAATPTTAPPPSPSTPTPAETTAKKMKRKEKLLKAVQFEHALYPSEAGDKHLVDIYSYLVDMAIEEQQQQQQQQQEELENNNTNNNSSSKKKTNKKAPTIPPRTYNVTQHVQLPPPLPSIPLASFPTQLQQNNNQNNDNNSIRSKDPAVLPSSVSHHLLAAERLSEPIKEKVLTSSSAFLNKHNNHNHNNEKERESVAPTAAPTPYAPGSALEGLYYFHQVVLRHTKPKADYIYASHLNGLSLTVHEFSSMSKPLPPTSTSSQPEKKKEEEGDQPTTTTTTTTIVPAYKKIFNKKARIFLKEGALPEVEMGEQQLVRYAPLPPAATQQELNTQNNNNNNNNNNNDNNQHEDKHAASEELQHLIASLPPRKRPLFKRIRLE